MRLVTAMVFLLLSAPLQAQEGQPQPDGGQPRSPQGWTVSIGAGLILSPAWQGSKDVALSLFPDLRIGYRDVLFASVPEGVGWNAINRDGWRAGPLAKVRFGRDERDGGSPFQIAGGSNALAGMGNVSAALELGGFIEKSLGTRREWRVRGEIRRGFGGHEGVVADASLSYRTRVGRSIASFGPRATVTSGDFMQTYYGIDANQSLRTGLTRYNAGGGVLSYGVGGTLVRPLNRRSALTLFGSLERLGGEAANSPLIQQRGQRTQVTLGVGYGLRLGR